MSDKHRPAIIPDNNDRIDVPDQVGTLSQVGTKKISKGGWTILELFASHGNDYWSFRSRSD